MQEQPQEFQRNLHTLVKSLVLGGLTRVEGDVTVYILKTPHLYHAKAYLIPGFKKPIIRIDLEEQNGNPGRPHSTEANPGISDEG